MGELEKSLDSYQDLFRNQCESLENYRKIIRNYIEEQTDILFCNEKQRRIKECNSSGIHKSPKWYTNNLYIPRNEKEKIFGVCEYCNSSIEREPNSKELEEIEDFRNYIDELGELKPVPVRKLAG
jgi:predicted DNA-binding protein